MRDVFQGTPLFAGLSVSALQLLGRHARESTVPQDHLILREGEAGRNVFLVERGEVRIFKTGRQHELELARMGEGGFFGEMGILDRQGRSASVMATRETGLVLLPYVALEILADEQPVEYSRFLENLARVLVERLRVLDDRFSTIT